MALFQQSTQKLVGLNLSHSNSFLNPQNISQLGNMSVQNNGTLNQTNFLSHMYNNNPYTRLDPNLSQSLNIKTMDGPMLLNNTMQKDNSFLGAVDNQ